MKKSFVAVAFFALIASVCGAQEIKTASNYFQDVSAVYGTIKDYEADVDMKVNGAMMKTKTSFKAPNLLRMDFTSPKEQTICFDGDQLTIYLPNQNAILTQHVSGTGNGANLATAQGLALLNRYYSVAYEIGPDPVALDDSSDEKVVKLEFKRKSVSESFRTIRIAVSADTKLIRRIEAVTGNNETFVFDFTNYSLNKGIPEQRFIYSAPTSANEYNNFLGSE